MSIQKETSSPSHVKCRAEFTGDAADAILDLQLKMRKSGSPKKNLGIVANILMNQLITKNQSTT